MTEPMLKPWRGRVTFRALADKIGRSTSHVYYVVRGKRKAGKALAKALTTCGYKLQTNGEWK